VPQVQIGALTVNLDTQQVLLGNQIVPLTQKEFALLRVLILAQGHPVSYSNLLRAVWDREDTGEYMRIRLTIRKLRAKLGENVDKPQFILTEDTVGYRINTMASETPAKSWTCGSV
jgi:DNA-binding response OmpR family regulator